MADKFVKYIRYLPSEGGHLITEMRVKVVLQWFGVEMGSK